MESLETRKPMQVENWGLVHYAEATRRQLELVDAVASGADSRLILCTHPPVVTVGRATVVGDVDGWAGEILETSRGGRATYHGPSQLVVYPIVDLRPSRDVHAFLRAVERASVQALIELGVSSAEARTTKEGEQSLTGVWVGERKIASIGVAVKKWISYHGMAVNIHRDEMAFAGIKPCGFHRDIMTSVEEQLGKKLPSGACNAVFAGAFLQQFR